MLAPAHQTRRILGRVRVSRGVWMPSVRDLMESLLGQKLRRERESAFGRGARDCELC